MLTDSHAHLSSLNFEEDLDSVLARAQNAGIGRIYNICTTLAELEKGKQINKKFPWVFNVGSTTPHDATTFGETEYAGFARAAREGMLAAIGETGLDYHYNEAPREKQQELFKKYRDLAAELKLPLVIHCREAFSDLFALLKEYNGKVLLHCFTGTQREAEEAIERNYFISLSGIVTFKKSIELQNIAKRLPLSHLLIETDAPYLAPQSHRGQRNEPSFLLETASFLAQLKALSLEEFTKNIQESTLRFFHDQF